MIDNEEIFDTGIEIEIKPHSKDPKYMVGDVRLWCGDLCLLHMEEQHHTSQFCVSQRDKNILYFTRENTIVVELKPTIKDVPIIQKHYKKEEYGRHKIIVTIVEKITTKTKIFFK